MTLVCEQPKRVEEEISFEDRARELKRIEELDKKMNKDSPFTRWTQFNLENTKELMWLAMQHPKAHAILYFLVDQMDKYNAVMCSYKVLEEVLGCSRQTISTNIKVLKKHHFIVVLKSGTSNVYIVNDNVYWKSWKNNKQYCKFPANVVLGLSEQEKEIVEEVEKTGFNKVKKVTHPKVIEEQIKEEGESK